MFRKSLGGGQCKPPAHAESQNGKAINLMVVQKSLNDFLKPLLGQDVVGSRSGLGTVKKQIEGVDGIPPFQLLRQGFEDPVILTNSVKSQ